MQISNLLSVGIRTVERRIRDFGLSVRATYADIMDNQLDATVLETLAVLPNTGYKRMSVYLRSYEFRKEELGNQCGESIPKVPSCVR